MGWIDMATIYTGRLLGLVGLAAIAFWAIYNLTDRIGRYLGIWPEVVQAVLRKARRQADEKNAAS